MLFGCHLKEGKLNKNLFLKKILERDFIFKDVLQFRIGDILIFFFWVKGLLYKFEGICICIKKRNLKNKDSVVILRNVLSGIGVEICISFYYNRLFFFKFSDYKRKGFLYNRAKLYYLRNRANTLSRVNL